MLLDRPTVYSVRHRTAKSTMWMSDHSSGVKISRRYDLSPKSNTHGSGRDCTSEAFHPAAVHLARPAKLPFETDLQDRRSAAPEGNWPFIGGRSIRGFKRLRQPRARVDSHRTRYAWPTTDKGIYRSPRTLLMARRKARPAALALSLSLAICLASPATARATLAAFCFARGSEASFCAAYRAMLRRNRDIAAH